MKRKNSSEQFPRKEIPVRAGQTQEETCRNHAEVAISPELAAYRVIHAVEYRTSIGEKIDVPLMLETLRQQADVIKNGDINQIEAMLINQATALQSLFTRLSEKALTAEYMTNLEGYMRLALRAQSQCRMTLKTLAEVKNPPTVYAQQANIAQGHQQVNNMASCPLVDENVQNQLLEEIDGERMDRRTTKAAIRTDQDMEAVGKVHGAED